MVHYHDNIVLLDRRAPPPMPFRPILATLTLADPIPHGPMLISRVELRDIAAGAAARRQSAERGDELMEQTIAALSAMSGLSLDVIEDMDLDDLGRVLSVVAAMLVMAA